MVCRPCVCGYACGHVFVYCLVGLQSMHYRAFDLVDVDVKCISDYLMNVSIGECTYMEKLAFCYPAIDESWFQIFAVMADV